MTNKKVHSLSRALDATADCIVRSKDWTVKSISAASKCSTSTLYDTFCSKRGLFLAARTLAYRRKPLPIRDRIKSESAFHHLTDILINRSSHFNDQTTVSLVISTFYGADQDRSTIRQGHRINNTINVIIPSLQILINEGLIGEFDPGILAYILCCVTAYEPIFLRAQLNEGIDTGSLLWTSLYPFLSDLGRVELEKELSNRGFDVPDVDITRNRLKAGIIGTHIPPARQNEVTS